MSLVQRAVITCEDFTLDRPLPERIDGTFIDTGAAGRIMLADDKAYWDSHIGKLHEFLAPDQISVAYSIADAIRLVREGLPYSAFVIDPALEFDDKKPDQESGFSLAQKIAQIEGTNNLIWMVSSKNSLLERAITSGFKRLYHKSNYVPQLYRSMDQFFGDLKEEMTRGRLTGF